MLGDMLRAMHLSVHEVLEAFEPEGGAYSPSGHVPAVKAVHVHGPDCNHGHGQGVKPVAIQVHSHKPHSH